MLGQYTGICFAGSRSIGMIPHSLKILASQAIAHNVPVHTGDCRGIDKAAVTIAAELRPKSANIYCVSQGYGWIEELSKKGVNIIPYAGGNKSIPHNVRLVLRAKAAVRGCGSKGLYIGYVDKPRSKGTLNSAGYAASLGYDVYLFEVDVSWPQISGLRFLLDHPIGRKGKWMPSEIMGFKCMKWEDDQNEY